LLNLLQPSSHLAGLYRALGAEQTAICHNGYSFNLCVIMIRPIIRQDFVAAWATTVATQKK
jgi:hypothetical protein